MGLRGPDGVGDGELRDDQLRLPRRRAQELADGRRDYLADGLGSTMAIVDASGNSQTSYQYDVYGEVTGGSGSLANEFDFDSQQTDGTGLQYLRARYYDPATGTFLSRDPLGRTEELASQRTPTAVRDDRLFAILRVCSQAPRRMTGALSALGGGLTVLRREPGRKLQIPSPRSYSTVNLPARTLFDIAFGRRA